MLLPFTLVLLLLLLLSTTQTVKAGVTCLAGQCSYYGSMDACLNTVNITTNGNSITYKCDGARCGTSGTGDDSINGFDVKSPVYDAPTCTFWHKTIQDPEALIQFNVLTTGYYVIELIPSSTSPAGQDLIMMLTSCRNSPIGCDDNSGALGLYPKLEKYLFSTIQYVIFVEKKQGTSISPDFWVKVTKNPGNKIDNPCASTTCVNSNWVGDTICDSSCVNDACAWDDNVCSTPPTPAPTIYSYVSPTISYTGCPTPCLTTYATNGVCDSQCNTYVCAYDSGACTTYYSPYNNSAQVVIAFIPLMVIGGLGVMFFIVVVIFHNTGKDLRVCGVLLFGKPKLPQQTMPIGYGIQQQPYYPNQVVVTQPMMGGGQFQAVNHNPGFQMQTYPSINQQTQAPHVLQVAPISTTNNNNPGGIGFSTMPMGNNNIPVAQVYDPTRVQQQTQQQYNAKI
jgi:hypothetical protein